MDIMASAVQLELDGERYYQQQAEKFKGTVLHGIFTSLSAEEASHARLLMAHTQGQPIDLPPDSGELSEQMTIFRSIGDFRDLHEGFHNQLEPYQAAMAMEKRSVELYRGLLGQAEDEAARQLYQYLIGEENKHFEMLKELVRHLNRPNEWVESAEFGVREDY